ncbi:MAG: NAD-dependent epimerase/dehydratase family protein [Halodesulfurarchaeum sp.]
MREPSGADPTTGRPVPDSLRDPDRTVLVTGGAGFIGSHLAETLANARPAPEVRVLDDLSTGNRDNVPDNATFVEGDVRDEEILSTAMEDVDVVFHQSALVSVEASVDDPRRSHSNNVEGTLAVLEASRSRDTRVIVASSAAIYGEPTEIPVPESHPKSPKSPYGLEKLTADRYTRLYHRLYGIETVALRYFNVYGPRQSAGDYSGVISIFLEQARSGQPITVHGDGSQTRDFVHVTDVVRANLLAAHTDTVGAAVNVGTGTETAVQELAGTISDLTDSGADIVHTDPRTGDIERSAADLSKAESALGYRPTVSLENGLTTML